MHPGDGRDREQVLMRVGDSRRAIKLVTWSLLGAVAAVTIGWAVKRRRIQIEQIPVIRRGRLTILGRGFGGTKSGELLIEIGKRRVCSDDISIRLWTDSRIEAELSDELLSRKGILVPRVRIRRRNRFGRWSRSQLVTAVAQADSLPSEPYFYEVPVQPDSPWPTFRRDHRNTGASSISAHYHGDQPWSFQTGKGIFSTPTIDQDGTIYVGSADHCFYAIGRDGTEKWRVETGEIIDSAAALLAPGLASECPTVVFPSGDGRLRAVRASDGTLIWSFDAGESDRSGYNSWFEGNVAVGYDGTLYAGNTNFNYYALEPDGSLKWTYATGSNNWSQGALSSDGTIYWASNDTWIRAVRPDGTEKWRRRTLGFVSASAAIGSDGTVYIGSFDSSFYALDPQNGRVKWRFRTGDHIYGSAALGSDDEGRTTAIYFGSTDGHCYALNPQGKLVWCHDTGSPIRSSPVIGRGPEGNNIVYVGAGNGLLYALEAADGSLRWSYDTTPEDPELGDRNDLNGSPALGQTGITIGGEHGQLWYIPYDYPLYSPDPRGRVSPGREWPDQTLGLHYVTPGGNLKVDAIPTLPPATIITLRLVARQNGRTLDARLSNPPLWRMSNSLEVEADPPFSFSAQVSGDGRYLHLIPDGFLAPDTDYAVHIVGRIYTGGIRIGNWTLGGRQSERLVDTFRFRTGSLESVEIPLWTATEEVAGFEWTRLALPIPTMLPSLNQIGFDYVDWIVGTVDKTEPDADGYGKLAFWAIGCKRDAHGRLVVDPDSDFILPFTGRYLGDAFIIDNHNVTIKVTGIPIPLNRLQLRGQLDQDLRVRPGATLYADARIRSIPTFGPLMVLAGLASDGWKKLIAAGTYVTRAYSDGDATQRPEGVWVDRIDYHPPVRGRTARVVATLNARAGTAIPFARRRLGILLINRVSGEPVFLDYQTCLRSSIDGGGASATIVLEIPAGTRIPRPMEAVIMVDVYPLSRHQIGK